ncbi:MAG TPA: hypothetical protein DD667_01885, partial [Gammaproteobacteria bacterium]|nr:hypothetical protein [Gammaproteobacteria bacterium]
VWQAIKKGTVPDMEDISNAQSTVEAYPWLLMCGQAMMEDMHDSRRAFTNEMDLILNTLTHQISDNKKQLKKSRKQ